MKRIKILHCPTMVGGNPYGLARAERKLGLDSWSIAFEQNIFAHCSDEILWHKKENYLIREFKRFNLLKRAFKDFDIVHFNFGRSIMPHWADSDSLQKNIPNSLLRTLYKVYVTIFELKDLPLLKKAGKKIAVTYQGSDARQDGIFDKHKYWQISQFSKYADIIYALNPDLLNFLPTRTQFMPYAHIDLNGWKLTGTDQIMNNPLVVHAPTARKFKGTEYILHAVSRLKNEGVKFRFQLVENLSNNEAKKIYQEADILIDQLLIGWYGGVAVEFMALAKPVICYINEADLKFIPSEMKNDLPIINANQNTIYQVLKEYLTSKKDALSEIGKMSRQYVEKWHNPIKIATELKLDYERILTKNNNEKK
ncbi:MAG: glycosyltransferase family 1 protein [Candidatus Omnitrophota bacterium]